MKWGERPRRGGEQMMRSAKSERDRVRSRTETTQSQILIAEIRRFWAGIAECEVTPENLLNQLAEHPDPEVRMALADNRGLSRSVIETLVEDENPDVRYRLAENTFIPLDLLNRLADDENPYVASRAEKTLSRIDKKGTDTSKGVNAFLLLARRGQVRSFEGAQLADIQ